MKRKVKWIFLAAIAVISIGAYAAVLLKPVEASAEQAVKGNLESQFTVSASILPVSGMVLNSVTAGNVSEIPYLPGMEVKEGGDPFKDGYHLQDDAGHSERAV